MYRVSGNIDGIKKTSLEQLDSLFDFQYDNKEFVNEDLLNTICSISSLYNREISIYIARNGDLLAINIGDNDSVNLAGISTRRDAGRLTGVRCIHTHPSGNPMLSDMDTSALVALKLDAMSAVSIVDAKPSMICTAVINPYNDSGFEIVNISPCNNIIHIALISSIMHAEELVDSIKPSENTELERVLLLGIDSDSSLDELEELAKTANVNVVDRLLQKRNSADSKSYIGEGKALELSRTIQSKNIETVICDDEISGTMQRRLEDLLNCRVIDRTALILDIFAKHSRSAESKLQVEAAQLQYRSQRLIGLGKELSRLGGGIGTRGPGESKLEVDRRRIHQRLALLEKEIKNIGEQRTLRRREREKSNIPIIALVGYTNAGKSSLLNALTKADAYVEDKLFATLDALSRKYKLSDGQEVLLVDTVGFIRKLPHMLIKTFASTLEEAKLADVIVIVLDGSSSEMSQHYATVCDTLDKIDAKYAPRIVAINKVDSFIKKDFAQGIYISAKTHEGLDNLEKAIMDAISERYITAKYFIPYSNMQALSSIHDGGNVIEEKYLQDGVQIYAKLPRILSKRICNLSGVKLVAGEICK